MSFDMSKVFSALGEELIAQAGEPVGLDKDQSVRVAKALAAHVNKGDAEAVKAAAADTGLSEDAVASMMKKLAETAKEKIMDEAGVNKAIDDAKAQAQAAAVNAGKDAMKNAGGMLGKLFGR
mgnify:CR=1 FL=1